MESLAGADPVADGPAEANMLKRAGPVRAIFFDAGDTLVIDDPGVEERLWIACKKIGLSFPRKRLAPALRLAETLALGEYVKGRPPETPEVAVAMFRVLLEEALDASPSDRDLDGIAGAYRTVPFVRRAQNGALDLLSELRRRGFVLGVISDWEPDLGDLLSTLGIRQHLKALAVSAIVGVTKPDPRLFQAALEEAEVTAISSVHIGDFLELDVAGASAAGMRSILLDTRRRSPDHPLRVETFDSLIATLLSLDPPAMSP